MALCIVFGNTYDGTWFRQMPLFCFWSVLPQCSVQSDIVPPQCLQSCLSLPVLKNVCAVDSQSGQTMRLSDFKTYGPALPRKVEARSARWIQTVLHLSQVMALKTGPLVGPLWQALRSAIKPRPTRDKKLAALFFISEIL